ncbi:hypothetical protein [Aurantiacibacter spongiae]|uniref:Uncharacterized protein n=1 Tax=Aurantiacibacter spongiae TaxID=2488860 RepID=A0A3N5CNC1_9SPHN|nr:hypothetical protein [Aurantiacibacter spongiae]RPF70434.1 hypothetical protein EG799_01420 [Aurantiacibacter spongiae]
MTIPMEIWKFLGVRGTIAAALALALGIALWRADAISEQRDRAVEQRALAEAGHAVTRASLDRLEGELAAFVQEGKLTRAEAVTAMIEAQDAGEDMRRAAAQQRRTDWRGQEGL